MAAKAARKDKDAWMYLVGDFDESYQVFPSYEAALKDAKRHLKENSYDFDTGSPLEVSFFQLAAISKFEFEVKETPVMTRTVTFKGEVK